MSNPKRHHYLPQVYLENFCQEGVLWIYNDIDKSIKNIPKINAAVINHFYTRENDDGTKDYELEKRLSFIEGEAGKIIKNLIQHQEITSEDKGKFSLFISLLQHRTPFAVNKLHQFIDPLLRWVKEQQIKNGIYDNFMAEYEEKYGMTKEFQKQLLENSEIQLTKSGEWGFLFDTAIEIAKLYSQMQWHFIYTTKTNFITSDNPLIYYEPNIDIGPYGYGIATPTVEKFIPISSNLILKIGDFGKGISYGLLNDRKIIRYINSSIFVRRKQFVFANNREQLEFLLKRTNGYKREEIIKIN